MQDLISRQAAIDAIKKDVENLDKELILYTLAPSQYTDNFKSCIESRIDGLNDALMDIESLPSAEPKTGEWIEVEMLPEVYDIEGVKTWGSKMQCDQCGFSFTAVEGHISQYNYCTYCGARMNGGEEE